MPLPPQKLRTGYFLTDDVNYIEVGRREAHSFLDFAQRHGVSEGRLLDFGCSSGRILRHLGDRSQFAEIYGVDVDTVNVNWALEYLPEHFKLVPITTFPSLPFEDNSFDLLVARSVFTHIRELAIMSLLEIRRVLRPGGVALITICDDEFTWERYRETPSSFASGAYLTRVGLKHRDFEGELSGDYLAQGFGADSLVIYKRSYIERVWGRFMPVLEIAPFCPETTPQSVVVLRKDRVETRRLGRAP